MHVSTLQWGQPKLNNLAHWLTSVCDCGLLCALLLLVQVQADFLQAKLAEEQGKRQRAEERARVLKNYSEKAKVRSALCCL